MSIIFPPAESIAFFIGSYPIHWYGILAAFAIALSYWGWRRSYHRRGYNPEEIDALIVWVIIGGVIGARLYYVFLDFSYYLSHPLESIALWNGGLAIHGALIGGAIALIVAGKKRNVSLLPLVNTLVPWLALGQAIGRWGNYVNQELYGKPTSSLFAVAIDPERRIKSYEQFLYFQPVFLYEFLGLVVIWIVLLVLLKKKPLWTTTLFPLLLYFVFTGLLRAAMELLRIDPMPLVFGLRVSLLLSAAIAVVAIVIALHVKRKSVVHS